MPANEKGRIVGVFGGWGAGKTHLLRLVGQELVSNTEHRKAIVAAFPSWKYELERDLGASLFSALSYRRSYPQLATLDEQDRVKLPSSVREITIRLLRLVDDIASPLASVAPEVEGVKVGVRAAEQALTERNTESTPRVVEIARLFEKLVRSICGEEHDRLVILVDDLDRCSPENMVRMFEWMKVHLDVPRCSFVVALDHKAAAHAITGKYKALLGSENDVAFGYRYLDKLFHSEFELASSPKAELMAVQQAFQKKETAPLSFSDAALEVMGVDFPQRAWLSELMSLPALRAARTMLRISYAFAAVLQTYRYHPEFDKIRPGQMLPRDTPFWLLLLVCMQSTLPPDNLDSFVNAQGLIFEGANSSGDLPERLQRLSPENPERQFGQFLHTKLNETSQARLPREDTLRRMLLLVRQKVI